MTKLSIIIPVYNESKTLERIVERVQKVKIPKINKELVIVNDCSKDSSQEVIDSLVRKFKNIRSFAHKQNRGKGAAIRTGLEHASGDIVTIQDGDLEYNPEDYKKMIKVILDGKSKVVYGSRFLKAHAPRYKLYYFGNKFLTLLTRVLYNAQITDMETCYKMMTYDVIRNLKLVSDRFEIEPEITGKILRMGYKIIEIPISYKSRSFEEGKKIGWRDGVKAIFSLIYWRISKNN